MKMMNEHMGGKRNMLRFWLQAAAIGGVYAALTCVLAPISYGPLQVRVSEGLTVLPYFTPAAVPGLFIGCFVSNMILSPVPFDFIIGSSATLAAALLSYALRRVPWLVPLPPVIINGVAIGAMLYFMYPMPDSFFENLGFSITAGGVFPIIFIYMGFVALGEAVACYAIGLPLLKYLERHKDIFEY